MPSGAPSTNCRKRFSLSYNAPCGSTLLSDALPLAGSLKIPDCPVAVAPVGLEGNVALRWASDPRLLAKESFTTARGRLGIVGLKCLKGSIDVQNQRFLFCPQLSYRQTN